MSQRIDRVDELLRQEIGAILAKDVQDPHIGFATVTDVEATPDLRHAKVWVSIIGDPAARRDTLAALARAMPYIRHELGARLRIRRIPMLHVELDDSAERGTRVLRILDELVAGDTEGGEAIADGPRGESLPTPVARLGRDGDATPAAADLPGDLPAAAESAHGGRSADAGRPARSRRPRPAPDSRRPSARNRRPGR